MCCVGVCVLGEGGGGRGNGRALLTCVGVQFFRQQLHSVALPAGSLRAHVHRAEAAFPYALLQLKLRLEAGGKAAGRGDKGIRG